MKSPSFGALAAEIRGGLEAVGRTVRDLHEARDAAGDEPSRIALWACGGTLHAFYTGLEKIIEVVASEVDGGVPSGPDWHRRLLRAAATERPGLRPAVLRAETVADLEEFLAFRHLYRNLYLFDLRWAPMKALLDRASPVWSAAASDLGRFAAWSDQMAAAGL